MGLLNSIKDHFTNAEFAVAPNKKVKTICADFKKAFGCTLAIYKGKQLADGDLTLNQLNQKTSKDVKTSATTELKIKASMKVGDAEKLFISSGCDIPPATPWENIGEFFRTNEQFYEKA